MDLHGPAWTCMDLHGPAWTCMDLHGPAWTCMDLHGPAWTCMDLPSTPGLPRAAHTVSYRCFLRESICQRSPKLCQGALPGLRIHHLAISHLAKRLRGIMKLGTHSFIELELEETPGTGQRQTIESDRHRTCRKVYIPIPMIVWRVTLASNEVGLTPYSLCQTSPENKVFFLSYAKLISFVRPRNVPGCSFDPAYSKAGGFACPPSWLIPPIHLQGATTPTGSKTDSNSASPFKPFGASVALRNNRSVFLRPFEARGT